MHLNEITTQVASEYFTLTGRPLATMTVEEFHTLRKIAQEEMASLGVGRISSPLPGTKVQNSLLQSESDVQCSGDHLKANASTEADKTDSKQEENSSMNELDAEEKNKDNTSFFTNDVSSESKFSAAERKKKNGLSLLQSVSG